MEEGRARLAQRAHGQLKSREEAHGDHAFNEHLPVRLCTIYFPEDL